MKTKGLVVLGIVGAVVAVAVAATQLGGGSSGSGGVLRTQSQVPGVVEQATADGAEALPPDALRDASGEVPAQAFSVDGSSGGTQYGGGDAAPPLPEVAGRKIVRSATISLSVEDVAGAVQRVETIASGAGGFVSESSVFVEPTPEPVEGEVSPPKPTQSATVTIRVPSTAYVSVMGQLRDLGAEVRSETTTTSDVTEEFADLQARLRNLEATEARYLELLGKAETISDILTLQDRINSVRLEIERAQGRINLLNDLTDLATITAELRPLAAPVEEPSEPGWAEEVWDEAWATSQDAMQALGTAGIVVGVVLAWLAIPALAIGIGWRLLGPRRPRGGTA